MYLVHITYLIISLFTLIEIVNCHSESSSNSAIFCPLFDLPGQIDCFPALPNWSGANEIGQEN